MSVPKMRGLRVLWFHPRPLLPPQGGGDLRTLGLLAEVVTAGHEVLLVTAGEPKAPAEGFEVAPVRLRTGLYGAVAKVASKYPLRSPRPTPVSIRECRQHILRFGPDVAVVSEVMTESLMKRLLPAIPWIYDAHNVEHALFDRMVSEEKQVFDRLTFAVDRRRVSRTERRLVQTADAVICVSEEDAAGLAKLGACHPPTVVRSSVPIPPAPATPAEAGPVALFVGTLDYPPNVAAVTELVEKVMPAVRASVSAARLTVVGRKAGDELRSLLRSQDWIDLGEDVPDVAPFYAASRCVVLPIRFGGGSRLKVSEALAWGLPTVGTAAAFAGLPIPEGVVLRAESAAEIAASVRRVLTDATLAGELGTGARNHFVSELSLPIVTRPLVQLLEQLA